MQLATRKVLDRSFSGLGFFAIALVAASLVVLLVPIAIRGAGAFVFRGTVEHRRLLCERFGHGDREAVVAEATRFIAARNEIFATVERFEREALVPRARRGRLAPEERARQEQLATQVHELKAALHVLLGPHRPLDHHLHELAPAGPDPALEVAAAAQHSLPAMPRDQYGQTRWDRAQLKLHAVLNREEWVAPQGGGTTQMLERVHRPRMDVFRGTQIEPVLAGLEHNLADILQPRWTFYWGFLTDESVDAHLFGGIWPEVLGTLYLTLGAILFAVPMGIIAAIYLVEYAPDNWLVGLLRSCVSTLAGVPSIVFGLFGLAFFINALHVSALPVWNLWGLSGGATGSSKSVLAGSLTLGLLILPMVIRASEEAIRAVPRTYKEAALSVGASKWHTVLTVVLPAALPGILTGVVISMGRAAGETAPIIFTAAVSVGPALHAWEAFTQPTPALPWNIYNLCTEHAAVEEIRHVQYGMVLTLVALVLVLNVAAIVLRARISRRLSG